MMNNIVTLITDFGLQDEYVGVMKGVILCHCPKAQLIDICHAVPPQNITLAARMLAASYRFFPEETIHLVIVDPSVGTDRAIIIVESDNHFFIAPDNGVLTDMLGSKNFKTCYQLIQTSSSPISSTFHGRDLMAPLAGKLAAGAQIEDLGQEIDAANCKKIVFPRAFFENNILSGEVVSIDHFGNISTSISMEDIEYFSAKLNIYIGKETVTGLRTTYAEVPSNTFLGLIDSRGYLEIAINCGNAAQKLGCRIGEKVIVRQG